MKKTFVFLMMTIMMTNLFSLHVFGNVNIKTQVESGDEATPQTPSELLKYKITEASEKGLIPNDLLGIYKTNITRVSFCRLIVNYIEQSTQMNFSEFLKSRDINNNWYYKGTISPLGECKLDTNYPFEDIEDLDVFNLHSIGAFNGFVSEKFFNPDRELTREEAASIVYIVYKLLKENINKGTISYSDKELISSWAVDGVDFVAANNVMHGVEENKFLPQGALTYEQAYVLILNLFNLDASKLEYVFPKGEFVIEPIYDSARTFSDGLALVSRDNKYFYIDKTGKEVIELPDVIYNPGDFRDGYACINTPDYAMVIDKSGNEILKFENAEVTDVFRSGEFFQFNFPDYENDVFTNNVYIDTKGNKYYYDYIFDFYEDMAVVRKNSKYGVINRSGKELVKPEFDEVEFLGDGFISVSKGQSKRSGWGIFDRNGKEVVGFGAYRFIDSTNESFLVQDGNEYKLIDKSGAILYQTSNSITDFGDGFAFIKKNSEVVIIDTTGKEVYKYNGRGDPIVSSFNEGIAAIKKDSKWKIIDTDFNEVAEINNDYAMVETFHEGMATVGSFKNKWGVIDSTGKEIIAPKYKWIKAFKNGYAEIATEDDKCGVIDKLGNVVIEPQYDEIEIGRGLFVVKKDEMYGAFDDKGNQIRQMEDSSLTIAAEDIGSSYSNKGITNMEKQHIYVNFLGGIDYSKVEAYYLDKSGNRYLYLNDAGGGFTKVSTSDWKYGYYDEYGNQITPIQYSAAYKFDEIIEGAAKVEKERKYGFIDKKGNVIIPIEYKSIGNFVDGIANAQKVRAGFIDEKGNVIIPFIYDSAGSFSEGLAYVCQNGKYGYIRFPY